MENEMFENNGIWIFALLILLFGANGNLFGNRNQDVATKSDVYSTSAFNQLQDENTAIRSDIQRTAYETMGVVKDSAYNNLSELRDIQAQVYQGSAASQKCCCDLSKELLENRYLNEKATADSTASLTAQINALRGEIAQDKINTLQSQVNDLKMQQMFCGIPRINPYGYGVYAYNYCNPCGCNNGNI